MTEEYINGVKIQKLPTYGKPLSYKTRKQRGHSADLVVSDKEKKKIKELVKILGKK